MISIALNWKEFTVDLNKINLFFKDNLSSNYDGLVCTTDNILVIFKEIIESSDSDIVNSYWDTVTEEDFEPTLQEIITAKINDARKFGNELMIQAAVENVAMGITQAGKTKQVADLFANLQYYLTTGSLYAAVAELQRIIDAGLDPGLAPFVTETRLLNYKNYILDYLS